MDFQSSLLSLIQAEASKFQQQYSGVDDTLYQALWKQRLQSIRAEVRDKSNFALRSISAPIRIPSGTMENPTLMPEHSTPNKASPVPSAVPMLSNESEPPRTSSFSGNTGNALYALGTVQNPDHEHDWSQQTPRCEPPTIRSLGLEARASKPRQRRYTPAQEYQPEQYSHYVQQMPNIGMRPPPTLQISQSSHPRTVHRQRNDPSRLSITSPVSMQYSRSFQSDASPVTPGRSTPGTSAMTSEPSQTGSFYNGTKMLNQDSHASLSMATGAMMLSPNDSANSLAFLGSGLGPTLPVNKSGSLTPFQGAQDMKRTGSSTSSERNRERLKNVNENAKKTMLMSKDQKGKPVIRVKSTKNQQSAGPRKSKKVPTKRKNTREKTCMSCPGLKFRGEHELRRHTEREHAETATRWRLRDGTAQARVDGAELPKVPFSSCTKCRSGKTYGVYYNAASHMRRGHFNPPEKKDKREGRRRNGTRTGYNGGNLPTMDVLKKYWMEEVKVASLRAGAAIEDDYNEEEDDAMELDGEGDEEGDDPHSEQDSEEDAEADADDDLELSMATIIPGETQQALAHHPSTTMESSVFYGSLDTNFSASPSDFMLSPAQFWDSSTFPGLEEEVATNFSSTLAPLGVSPNAFSTFDNSFTL